MSTYAKHLHCFGNKKNLSLKTQQKMSFLHKKRKLTSTSSMGVLSGISRSMTMHLLWLGRTLMPSSSTWTFGDSLRTSVMSFMSLVSFLTWLKFATVHIGTYWSLSICDSKYVSFARFSLKCQGQHLYMSLNVTCKYVW